MRRLNYAILIILLSFVSSCDNGFEELNKNPIAPSNVNSGAIFNSIISSLQLGWSRQLFLHNEVLYDVTEQAVVTAQTFGNTDGGASEMWNNYYTALKNASELYRRFEANEDPNIGDVMKSQLDIVMAYKTFQMTDFFGDIPYYNAGKAYDDEVNLRPNYDSQKDIYHSLIDNLTRASQVLTSGGTTAAGNPYERFGGFETLFNDDSGKWTRFSNSLLLRHLMRMYEVDPDYVTPRIKELIESGANFLVENGDAVMSPSAQLWSNLGVNWSFREHNKVRMGTTMWEAMTDDAGEIFDPRLRIFFETNNADEWAPFPQIADNNTPQSGGEPYQKDKRDASYEDKGLDNIYSPVNFYLIRDEKDIPEILMTAAEVKFLQAEIFLRGIGVAPDPFLAAGRYQDGILASLNFWQDLVLESEIWINKPPLLSTGPLFQVATHPKYAFDTGGSIEDNLRLIHTQRWMDSFRQPWEAFALMRRSELVPRAKEENNFFRFMYPQSEGSLNAENYQTQVSKMGRDATGVKLWWNK